MADDLFEALVEDPSAPLEVSACSKRQAAAVVVQHHYLHRRPNISYAFGLWRGLTLLGVVTFGVPASRHLQLSACRTHPELVLELNRLWVHDAMPRNTESWFVARALKMLPAKIIVSYADTAHGHIGFVYRALSFRYAGWTDMDRKTPRWDYIPHDPSQHTREASRSGYSHRVRRRPKIKYWTTTGTPAERRSLVKLCCWPEYDWHAVSLAQATNHDDETDVIKHVGQEARRG